MEYDLVVIGNSQEAIYAALVAVNLKARVALVQQPSSAQITSSETIFRHTYSQITQWQNPLHLHSYLYGNPALDLKQINAWVEEVTLTNQGQNSPAILEALGVDVIQGNAEFCRQPQQALLVNQRRLRSRAYLIATGSVPLIRQVEGLETTGYLTPAALGQEHKLANLPENLAVIGNNPTAIELTQILARLNKQVTLVIEDQCILPQEDRESAQLIQAQLEAEGVKIILAGSLEQARLIDEKKWLQINNRAIEVEEIIIAHRKQPNIAGLNLEGVGVKWKNNGIVVNNKLQTSNSRIYACGDVLGGYTLTQIGIYEATLAIKNALFLPIFKTDYSTIAWTIATNPHLARVGLTEVQARRFYGEDVLVVRQYFKQLVKAQILGQTTGFCKLIILKNGRILGAHIVGVDAGEIIGAIALAIKEKIKLKQLANLYVPHGTLSEIFHQAAYQWQQQKIKQNKTLSNLLETWHLWRRN